ncbi:hypothetical protein [Streptomyces sp. NPDC006971]|uniref:hypothetical protein n=1 Tax=Streptomyces sp. NPDC006971 TaxID=3154784 RepID=UPI0033C6AE02
MPWVRLDDRFPSHRKVALLSDRAFRLYVSALCWSSENLTEGRILAKELPLVSRVRGPKAAAAELEAAGLWDRAETGWVIHDYLEYNPDRARVQADREANAARQKAFRERKKAERDAARNGDSNAPRNGVTPDGDCGSDDTTEARRRHDGDTNARRSDQTNQQSPQVSDVRNGVSNGPPSPSPSRPVLPTEVPPPPTPSVDTSGTTVDTTSGRGEVQPLIDAMGARQMRVSWSFSATEWLALRDAIRRVGVPALVDHAARAWQAAKSTPYSARYFLAGWTGLQDAPQYTGPRSLTAGPPSKTSAYLESMAAITEELRAAEGGTQ